MYLYRVPNLHAFAFLVEPTGNKNQELVSVRAAPSHRASTLPALPVESLLALGVPRCRPVEGDDAVLVRIPPKDRR